MKFVKWALAAAMTMSLGLPTAHADAPFKAAWIYVGPVSDHGYIFQHDQGRKAVEAALGAKVKTTFVESVPEGADAERVLTQLARDGNKLIFSTSFGFMNATLKVARAFPDVKFEHATGYKRAANVSTFSARFYEGRAVLGTIAGKMTKTGVVGYIASIPIPEVVRGIDAFTIALRKVRPDAKVKVIYVNSWYDPGKEAAAAKALIDQGADVLAQHTDSAAPVQTAEERGVWCFGQSSDMTRYAPHRLLTGIIENWDQYDVAEVKAAMNGSWKSHDTWGGLASGMVKLSPYNPAMPRDVVAAAEKTRQDIIAGKLNPFAGPITDQSGKLVVPAGKSLSDAQLLGLRFYVQGVEGNLPK